MCGLSALRASGRFRVIVALCPSTSYLMVSYDRVELSDIFGSSSFSDSGGSAAIELWRPSFAERCQPLFEILGSTGEFEVEELLRHGLAQRRMLAVVDRLLGQA